MTTKTTTLAWIGERWHCDGRPIEAGQIMELRGFEGDAWLPVRIETSHLRNLDLVACVYAAGMLFTRHVDATNDLLRWPSDEVLNEVLVALARPTSRLETGEQL